MAGFTRFTSRQQADRLGGDYNRAQVHSVACIFAGSTHRLIKTRYQQRIMTVEHTGRRRGKWMRIRSDSSGVTSVTISYTVFLIITYKRGNPQEC